MIHSKQFLAANRHINFVRGIFVLHVCKLLTGEIRNSKEKSTVG